MSLQQTFHFPLFVFSCVDCFFALCDFDVEHDAWIVFIGMQESQGFTRSTSNNRLIYDYEEETQDTSVETEASEEYQDEVWFSYECGPWILLK